MNVQKTNLNNMSLHLIKTKKFKNVLIDVVLQKKITKDEYSKYTFLSYILSECCQKYPSRKTMAIACEKLYNLSYSCHVNRSGNYLNFSFSFVATNPSLLQDESYMDEVYKFLYEVIKKPNIDNKRFNQKTFDIIKNYMEIDIKSIQENPQKVAYTNALNFMDSNSISASDALGNIELLNKITPEILYDTYQDLINTSHINVFIIGKYHKQSEILSNKSLILLKKLANGTNDLKINDLYVNNKIPNDIKYREDFSSFIQSQLICIYNTSNLNKKEKEIVMPLMNYILGSGGLKSKLYDKVREKKGYCYQIVSFYNKYDNLLFIASSLKKDNCKDATELIRLCIQEMADGVFTKEDIKDAKKNMVLSLSYMSDNISGLLNSYEYYILNGNYQIPKKLRLISKITKKEIVDAAGKLKENVNYLLCEGKNENI